MTREKPFARGCYREARQGEKKGDFRGVYSSPEEVRMAYDNGEVDLHAGIRCRVRRGKHPSTRPSVACSSPRSCPKGLPFELVNKTLDKKALSALIDACYRTHRNKDDRPPRRPPAHARLRARDERRRLDLHG